MVKWWINSRCNFWQLLILVGPSPLLSALMALGPLGNWSSNSCLELQDLVTGSEMGAVNMEGQRIWFPFALNPDIIPSLTPSGWTQLTGHSLVSRLRKGGICPAVGVFGQRSDRWWELSADPASPLAVSQGKSCLPLQLFQSSCSSLGHSWVRRWPQF